MAMLTSQNSLNHLFLVIALRWGHDGPTTVTLAVRWEYTLDGTTSPLQSMLHTHLLAPS